MSNPTRAKRNGIHYTPPELAEFLAEVTIDHFRSNDRTLDVLDPSCGDGQLLLAVARAVPAPVRTRSALFGYEIDPSALSRAGANLARVGAARVVLKSADFLADFVDHSSGESQPGLFDPPPSEDQSARRFDLIIANPPYVRTQVLGAAKAQDLARRFGLSGRVDLYQAFIKAMAAVLRPGGTLGLVTSNRFLTIQSGAAIRGLLRSEFDLRAVYDLGDTKIFSAAVLPAIVVGRKRGGGPDSRCAFHRVYASRSEPIGAATPNYQSIPSALRAEAEGAIEVKGVRYRIERGTLDTRADPKEPWTLATSSNRDWMARVDAARACDFEQVGAIRVGIKTTADRVFIRDDWHLMPDGSRPEDDLLHPLLTHHVARRWKADSGPVARKKVLYPHRVRHGRREPIDLDDFPKARAYLESRRPLLESRRYVVEAGRRWYEIWVPQDPEGWSAPKVVFPDIAESPRFFLDRTGAIVNGDCYWLVPKPGRDPAWLRLILAVANSSFITRYYDTVFHNKLYAGRRRFITQYVKSFPLPDPGSPPARRVVELVARLEQGDDSEDVAEIEAEINELVWRSFGLVEEVSG